MRAFWPGYAAIVLGLALVESVFRYITRRTISGTSRMVEYDIRTELATRLMHLDQHYYLEAQTGDLMARCTNDLQRVRDLLGPATQDLFRLPIMLLLGLGLMLTIDVGLALVSVAYFPLMGLAIIGIRTAMETRYRRRAGPVRRRDEPRAGEHLRHSDDQGAMDRKGRRSRRSPVPRRRWSSGPWAGSATRPR